MARTKEEITQEIQEAFVSNAVLKQLYSLSDAASFNNEFSLVSLEGQLIEVFSHAAKTIEDLLDAHTRDVNHRIELLTPGTLLWYQRQALLFQIGDELEWNAERLRYEYAVLNEDAQVVKLASVNETSDGLLIKVANLFDGIPVPLEPAGLQGFKDYMDMVKFAGVNVTYVSRPADKILLHLRVYYDPKVLSSDGSLLTDSSKYPVREAVSEYLQLRPFNGRFNVTDLIDSLQKVKGVVNPIFEKASAWSGTSPEVQIADYYLPIAGYMEIDTLEVDYVLP